MAWAITNKMDLCLSFMSRFKKNDTVLNDPTWPQRDYPIAK